MERAIYLYKIILIMVTISINNDTALYIFSGFLPFKIALYMHHSSQYL